MGLYDRDYMQDAKRPPENAGRMLMGIIIINIIFINCSIYKRCCNRFIKLNWLFYNMIYFFI